MKRKSNKDSANALKENQTEIIDAFEQLGSKYDRIFYVIGAFARDYSFSKYEFNSRAVATEDIDFAVNLDSISEYQTIKEELQNRGFEASEFPYRLSFKDVKVDILPFGGIAEKDSVKFNENHLVISVLGFEIAQTSPDFQSPHVGIVRLPEICILKLIAYSERKAERRKDLQDFTYILENYFNIFTDKFTDEYLDILVEYRIAEIAGAVLLGREMNVILNEYKDHRERIVSVLLSELPPFSPEEIEELEFEKEDINIKRRILIATVLNEISHDM